MIFMGVTCQPSDVLDGVSAIGFKPVHAPCDDTLPPFVVDRDSNANIVIVTQAPISAPPRPLTATPKPPVVSLLHPMNHGTRIAANWATELIKATAAARGV